MNTEDPNRVLDILERIAETGTAPTDGCHLFGVGFEDAFERLKKKYLEGRIARGGSAEKFIVGPYGAGKTHFLRELMEIGRDLGLVTSEVALNKEIDVTDSLLTYREVVRNVRVPGKSGKGIDGLLHGALNRVEETIPEDTDRGPVIESWIDSVGHAELESMDMRRVLAKGLSMIRESNEEGLAQATRWLAGDVGDRRLARDLGVRAVTKAEHNLFGRNALLSLCQFVRLARFPGVIVGFDEAEQGLNVQRSRREKVLSLLQSQINAVADVRNAGLLLVFAVTKDVIESMEEFPALQQRVVDPAEGYGFFDGNTLAPKINLDFRGQTNAGLQKMGRRLLDLFLNNLGQDVDVNGNALRSRIDEIAEDVARTEATSAARRVMAKRTAALLVHVHDGGGIADFRPPADIVTDDEF